MCSQNDFPHTKIQIQKGFLEPEIDGAHHYCRINKRSINSDNCLDSLHYVVHVMFVGRHINFSSSL